MSLIDRVWYCDICDYSTDEKNVHTCRLCEKDICKKCAYKHDKCIFSPNQEPKHE